MMSKKGAKEPYKSGGKWYLDGRLLNCESCNHYRRDTSGDVGDYCGYHRFKFKNELSPGSDYSQCEQFSYNKNSGGLGLVGKVIIVLIIIFIYVISPRLF